MKKIQAMYEVGSDEKSSNLWEQEVLGGSVIRKPGIMFVPPSVVEQNVKRKPGLDLRNFPKTVSLATSENLGARA